MDKMAQCFLRMLATFFILSSVHCINFQEICQWARGVEVSVWAKQLIINDTYYVKSRKHLIVNYEYYNSIIQYK